MRVRTFHLASVPKSMFSKSPEKSEARLPGGAPGFTWAGGPLPRAGRRGRDRGGGPSD